VKHLGIWLLGRKIWNWKMLREFNLYIRKNERDVSDTRERERHTHTQKNHHLPLRFRPTACSGSEF
jgi:hypothetical protein